MKQLRLGRRRKPPHCSLCGSAEHTKKTCQIATKDDPRPREAGGRHRLLRQLRPPRPGRYRQ